VRLDIYGGGLLGSAETFVRYPPVAQTTLDNVSSVVARDEFAGISALIVGGSRGLGELTAKALAVGGGNVTITYAIGKAEADAVAADITAWGGRCKVICYDVRKDAAQQLSAITQVPTHIYYFSTPRIFRARYSQLFSPDIFQEFNDFYVIGFLRLVEASLQRWSDGFGVFYPSSVAVQDRPAGMAEYAMSKAAGEILCADITAQIPKARITVSRLPRLLTDQTATLGQPATPDALAIMLPLIRDFS
jgi:NAD(P)-dependent dehydrogenase (short-subunit alcohol dehydrogenase family)